MKWNLRMNERKYVRKIEKNILTYENLFGMIVSIRNATFPIER